MKRINILRAIRALVTPVLITLGFIHITPAMAQANKTAKNTMRTYYQDTTGKVSSKKPQGFIRTVRAESVSHARKILEG